MGMDVFGNNPRNKEGEYFRNNVWWWRPLADFILECYPEIASIGTATTEMVLTLTTQKNSPKDCRPTLKMAKFPNGKKTITNGVLRFLVKRAKFVIAQVFGLISVELKWECPTKNFLPKTKFLLAANTVGATVATVWEQKKIGLVHIRLKLTT